MAIAHEHNLHVPPAGEKPYGIRVSLKPGDPFARLVGADWQKLHWFATERDRDAVLADMAGRHVYSRRGDEPAVVFEKLAR
ncbi:MAG: hypothetical protein ACREVI_01390 [Steroidobacteraceae bacterium]